MVYKLLSDIIKAWMQADLKSPTLTKYSSAQALFTLWRLRTVNIAYSMHNTSQTTDRKQTPVKKTQMYSLLALSQTVLVKVTMKSAV